ncbi:type ISP restriction/modification enzyme, partial [Cupriavidus basilensis]|uniref:type ISP restriction/modification enzyme n=1 Tax=Cupriavidus basilensis TaxID=68895 RepID=UPI001C2D131C
MSVSKRCDTARRARTRTQYVVNGKPALDWVVERQCVKTDKDSGIVNDANDWAAETIGNPRYPL